MADPQTSAPWTCIRAFPLLLIPKWISGFEGSVWLISLPTHYGGPVVPCGPVRHPGVWEWWLPASSGSTLGPRRCGPEGSQVYPLQSSSLLLPQGSLLRVPWGSTLQLWGWRWLFLLSGVLYPWYAGAGEAYSILCHFPQHRPWQGAWHIPKKEPTEKHVHSI